MDLYYKSGSLYCRETEEKKEYFYEDGTPKTIEPYLESKLHGEVLLYWPNGKIKRKCHFKNGARNGIDQMWNDSGILVDEGSYEMGSAVGTHRRYSQKGSLIEEITYLVSPRFTITGWDEQGELRLQTTWEGAEYREKVWDRFQKIWIEKEGFWDGSQLVYR